ITWTFLFRRILLNPSYYGVQDTSTKGIYKFLDQIIENVLEKLALWKCIIVKNDDDQISNSTTAMSVSSTAITTTSDGKAVSFLGGTSSSSSATTTTTTTTTTTLDKVYKSDYNSSNKDNNNYSDDDDEVEFQALSHKNPLIYATYLGRIACDYYLKCKSVAMFQRYIKADNSIENVLKILSSAYEYEELPVRHNEDKVNENFAKLLTTNFDYNNADYDSPFIKTEILFRARFQRLAMPMSDYKTDLRSILDQGIRIPLAMLDVAAHHGYYQCVLNIMTLLQMIT
ncbi:unnamed protein product, partial [marine sediment metagenome]